LLLGCWIIVTASAVPSAFMAGAQAPLDHDSNTLASSPRRTEDESRIALRADLRSECGSSVRF